MPQTTSKPSRKLDRKSIELRQGDSDSAQEIQLYQSVTPLPDAVTCAMMYPASYSIALSSLGYMTLFRQLDKDPNVAVERVYQDTLERYNPKEFELMGYSFAFELDVVAILKGFETYDIPFYAADRDRHHPLIFAGGPVPMTNAEPFAPFFDFFLIGEGEDVMGDLITAYQEVRHIEDREALIHKLAAMVPGLYAPGMYDVSYESDRGPITAITPKYDDIPDIVTKRMFQGIGQSVATTPILSDKAIFSNKFLVEVMRGCAHRCRFCMASYATLPARGPELQPILDAIELGLKHTNKIGLLGALIANHPNFDEICTFLRHKMDANPDINISAASLRVDRTTDDIVKTFVQGKQDQLTVAIETGSEKLQKRINKNLKRDDIIQCAETAYSGGLKGLKFYGMVGLPDETDEDVLATAELMQEIHATVPKLKMVLGCSSFIPKGGTPFQWADKLDNKMVKHRFEVLKKGLQGKNKKSLVADFRPSSAKWDYFQAFLSRGDRRLAPLLVRFYELGGSLGHINRALKEFRDSGKQNFPDLDWYALRAREESEILPWDMVSLGIPRDILYKEGALSAI